MRPIRLQPRHDSAHRGITFTPPTVDVAKLRTWKESILEKLGGGVASSWPRCAAYRSFRAAVILKGHKPCAWKRSRASSSSSTRRRSWLLVPAGDAAKVFDLGNPRIMTSTEALEVEDIPENLLVVGGGYIGMELGTVYAALGSKTVLVEALDSILAGADPDLARPVVANAKKMFKEIRLKAKVTKMATAGKQIKVEMDFNGEKLSELYDRVLVAVGRVPNSADLGLKNTKVELDEKGFVKVNHHQQTADPAIYAIGDIAGVDFAGRTRRTRRRALPSRTSTAKMSALKTLSFRRWCLPTRNWRGAG